MSIIKTLDWNDTVHKRKREQFIDDVKESCTKTGFFLLRNHTISSGLFAENREKVLHFMKEVPEEVRKTHFYPTRGSGGGYFPMSSEQGEFANVADHKHFFQVPEGYATPDIAEVPGMAGTSDELFLSFRSQYAELMKIIALSLDLDETFFDSRLGNSMMRDIHYPENDNPTTDDGEVTRGGNITGMCSSKHTDINFLTLLHAISSGLQLRYRNEWIPIKCSPDTIIVNVGDMLEHLTGGKYVSGMHRVVCEPGIERFSCPFFGHCSRGTSIVPLQHLPEKYQNTEKYFYKTVGPYLDMRIDQINANKSV